jgi:hypothetical protein
MGSKGSKQGDAAAAAQDAGSPVTLNAYQMSEQNPSLPGFGVWHTGIEVYGVEYTFGKRESSLSGISAMKPRSAPGVIYKESVEVGRTKLSAREVRDLVTTLGSTFAGDSYHVTGRNCNHFSEEFCQRLCGTGIPGWVNRAAKTAHAIGLGNMIQKSAEEQRKSPALPIAPSTFSAVQVDLRDLLAPSAIECLNEDSKDTLRSIMVPKPAKAARLRSDADPQLLMTVGFVQHVRITALAVRCPVGPTAPRRLLLFVNRRNLDFTAVESVEPTCEVVLTDEDVSAGKAVALPTSKFTNVKDLTIFVSENSGADVTEIMRLAFIGAPLINTDMSQFKAVHQLHDFYMDAD